jgi:hypothetical protein
MAEILLHVDHLEMEKLQSHSDSRSTRVRPERQKQFHVSCSRDATQGRSMIQPCMQTKFDWTNATLAARHQRLKQKQAMGFGWKCLGQGLHGKLDGNFRRRLVSKQCLLNRRRNAFQASAFLLHHRHSFLGVPSNLCLLCYL